ncbi:ABC transporter permease [Cellulomonas cellasea]|uniref:Transport permease protein n=1 Tax=Cellulomonas cellasea TaxID=43670 RepID=A0A7W4UGM3_9CELL|nr:ABC transporter permease [Cellulomonas cellasea]MBB2923817.1 ABC transporter DrrB family efflux protein [Cellulomonas cellasea]
MSATLTAPAVRTAVPTGSALRWALADGWTIALRDLQHWRRQPGQLAVGLLFPVLMVVMFGYLLGGGMAVEGGGSYLEFLMPGMFALTMVFGLESTMTAVATDAEKGVTDRFRSMPMSSAGVVLGRCIADMLSSVVGLAVMVGVGLLVGWRWHEGPARAALAIALLLLLRFAFLWVGIYLGLVARGPGSVMAVQIVVWPFAFLSNAFVPTSTMPAWLGAVAQVNPMAATVAAARELFGNPGVAGDGWLAEHSVLAALVWPTALAVVFFALAVRRWVTLGR